MIKWTRARRGQEWGGAIETIESVETVEVKEVIEAIEAKEAIETVESGAVENNKVIENVEAV